MISYPFMFHEETIRSSGHRCYSKRPVESRAFFTAMATLMGSQKMGRNSAESPAEVAAGLFWASGLAGVENYVQRAHLIHLLLKVPMMPMFVAE